MAYSILEITDGTDAVSLISTTVGLHLKSWQPAINQFKGDGVWQDNSQVAGRRLAQSEFANARETFTLAINGRGQDALIRQLTRLLELLLQATYYWQTEKGSPVYLKAKSPCETGTRYTEIRGFSIPGIKNPYAQPFFTAQELALLDEIELDIERLFWLANPPGTGECVELASSQSWNIPPLWETVTTSVSAAQPIIQLSDGSFRAGGISGANNPRLYTSADGVTWAVISDTTGITAGVGVFKSLLADSTRYYAGTDGSLVAGVARLFRSTNLATSNLVWASVFTEASGNAVRAIIQANDSSFIIITDLNVHRSTTGANGSWSAVRTGGGSVLFKDSQGNLYAGGPFKLSKSTDHGATWSTVLYVHLSGGPNAMAEDDNGNIYVVLTEEGYVSSDNGVTWEALPSMPASFTPDAMTNAGGVLYMVGIGSEPVWYSIDGGLNWIEDDVSAITITAGDDVLLGTDDYLYVTDSGNNAIHRKDLGAAPITMGVEEDCDGETYLANHYLTANLTHIKISDGGVFTNLLPFTSYPTNLLPATPATNDALYFGISTADALIRGPFSGLVLDIASPLLFSTSITTVWEYWNGAWVTLSTQDNTALSGALSRVGVTSVHWARPSDWTTTAIDSVTAYWVRLRVTGTSGTLISTASQQNRQIYAIAQPFIEFGDVAGDIAALLRLKLLNRSDVDGRGGSAPNLWSNRVIAGLRSFETSSYFRAFINLSDYQPIDGVTLTLLAGGEPSYTTDVTAPTGRRLTYSPSGVNATLNSLVTVSFSALVARDYYGSFHAYVRARRAAGSSTDYNVRLQVVAGSGGISFTTESKQLQTTTAFELLDFGQIDIPPSGAFKESDLGDTLEIRIQANAAVADLYLYDLILIPVDEWAIDAVDIANSTASIIGRAGTNSNQLLLDIDSVSDPLLDIKSLVRQNTAQEMITSVYNPITGGEAMAQVGVTQRLWVLCAQTSATGSSYSWIAPPDISHSVQAFKNERYLALRGDR